MADDVLQAELLAACSSLGYSDGNKYYRDPDCLETIKDLIRYLRRDDDSHQIRRALGETRVVQTDLISIICDYSDEEELFDVTLRLLVNLTNPVLLLFREELPEEKVTRQQFIQLVGHQQCYKEKFADEHLWKTLVGKLEKCLGKEWNDRQEEDKLIIERILILIRNILSVPANPQDEQRTDDDASIHDQVIWSLHLAHFEVLLQYIASSEQEEDLAMHALEIISLMLREQDAEELAHSHLQRSQSEKTKDQRQLQQLVEKENALKQQKIRQMQSRRHSRFGGTYCIMNMKSISDRDIISHQPVSNIKDLNFDKLKKPRKTPKNRQPLQASEATRRSTLAIRVFLQNMCNEFLNGSYNRIMYIVKDNISRGKSQENDETYYFWAMKFFMAFNRHHNFKIELCTETLSVNSFHYIQQQVEHYNGMMTTDKKKIRLWSRRMHTGLRAYQELLLTLANMDKSLIDSERESSKVIKCKVFYVVEYREFLLILLQNFDEVKMSKNYLKDLVETTHTFLKLLEILCSKNKHMLVQGKGKRRKQKKKPSKKPQEPQTLTEEQIQEKWSSISDDLSAVIQGDAETLPQTVPFDSLSEESEDHQKETAMRRIHQLLHKNNLEEAVSLLRSAREVWPEGDIFGSGNIDSSEEFMCLRLIYQANLELPQETVENRESSDHEEDEEELEESMPVITEQELNFGEFVRRYANSKVLKAYGTLFKHYKTNSTYTNHCILKMFHRIGWDSKLSAIFYQASLFKTFQEVLNNPQRKVDDSLKEIAKFAKFILKKFFETAKENKKVFVELLFWKNKNEAVEIECGYDVPTSTTASKKSWSEEEEDELKRLYFEFRNKLLEHASDGDDRDTVDYIMGDIINKERSRRVIIIKLKELGLITHTKQLKRKTISIRSIPWTDDEETELKVLFEEYKDANDPLGMILNNMMNQKPRQKVIKKILELGLVNDRKELKKKRTSKNPRKKAKNNGERFLSANRESDNSDIDLDSSDSDSDSGSDLPVAQTTKSYTSKLMKSRIVSPTEIASALQDVINNNIRDPISWIAELLEETADDREKDGDNEPIPILALTSECTDAMEDDSFLNLLNVIGLRPPANHQETLWRIPSNISVDGLRKRSQYLLQGLSGELVSDVNHGSTGEDFTKSYQGQNIDQASNNQENIDDISSDKENIFSGSHNTQQLSGGISRINDDSDDSESATLGKKRTMHENSDSDSTVLSVTNKFTPKSKPKRRKVVIDDDTDSDNDSIMMSLTKNTSVADLSISQKVIDSDSENDLPIVNQHKSRAIVDSDDD